MQPLPRSQRGSTCYGRWAGGQQLPSHTPAPSVGPVTACVRSRQCAGCHLWLCCLDVVMCAVSCMQVAARRAPWPPGCHSWLVAWQHSSPASTGSPLSTPGDRGVCFRRGRRQQCGQRWPVDLLGAAADNSHPVPVHMLGCWGGVSRCAWQHRAGSGHTDCLAVIDLRCLHCAGTPHLHTARESAACARAPWQAC
jgi:hypothetical protein